MENKEEIRASKWKELDSYILKLYRPRPVKTPNDIVRPKKGMTVGKMKKMPRGSMRPIEMYDNNRKLLEFNFATSKTLLDEKTIESLEDALKLKEESFQSMLFRLIDESKKKDSEVYTKANIDKRLFSKIRSDSEYHPSKSTVILLCFGLELEIDTALDFISKAGYSLSFARKQDIIVRYFLEKKNYDLNEVNTALYDYDLPLLFK